MASKFESAEFRRLISAPDLAVANLNIVYGMRQKLFVAAGRLALHEPRLVSVERDAEVDPDLFAGMLKTNVVSFSPANRAGVTMMPVDEFMLGVQHEPGVDGLHVATPLRVGLDKEWLDEDPDSIEVFTYGLETGFGLKIIDEQFNG